MTEQTNNITIESTETADPYADKIVVKYRDAKAPAIWKYRNPTPQEEGRSYIKYENDQVDSVTLKPVDHSIELYTGAYECSPFIPDPDRLIVVAKEIHFRV